MEGITEVNNKQRGGGGEKLARVGGVVCGVAW